jgi:hypothetical protein
MSLSSLYTIIHACTYTQLMAHKIVNLVSYGKREIKSLREREREREEREKERERVVGERKQESQF